MLSLRVTPRAKREELGAGRDGRFAARVAAPPVDGAANAAVIALVAAAFGIGKRAVSIVYGDIGRDKRVLVEGDADRLAQVAARLYGAAP